MVCVLCIPLCPAVFVCTATAGETFGVAPLTWDDWTYVLRFAAPILLVEEVLKVKKVAEVRKGMSSLCSLSQKKSFV